MSEKDLDKIAKEILSLVEKYHAARFAPKSFVPGKTPIPPSQKVFDSEEMKHIVLSALDFHLTHDKFSKEFEKQLATQFGLQFAMFVNSGSSANLLAVSALTSPKLGSKALQKGDEIITAACGFPTTVAPIYQNQLQPVFLDAELGNYNIDTSQLEESLSDKTKAIIVAHTLGNPFNLDKVTKFAKKHNLFLIEDCCDALGSTFEGKHVGGFGDMATLSLYPAHHITTGEGGAVLTNDSALKLILASFKDWGRDCWCEPGISNTCGKRFKLQLGELPFGYDHKYTFSHIGYNLKATEMQAAIGIPQIKKLPKFIKQRKENFNYLYKHLKDFEDLLILPKWLPSTDPSWFGFPISLSENASFTRLDLTNFLEKNGIGTRTLFAGNLTKQPAYVNTNKRVIGNLKNTDYIMQNTFWIGVHPGITDEMREYIVSKFAEFFKKKR